MKPKVGRSRRPTEKQDNLVVDKAALLFNKRTSSKKKTWKRPLFASILSQNTEDTEESLHCLALGVDEPRK